MTERKILVRDLDPMMPDYRVYDVTGRNLGEKCRLFGLQKPAYRKDGRHTIGRYDSLEKLKYKKDPPWFSREVVEIKSIAGRAAIIVKGKDD